ncbi:ABC transporter permease subunit [Kribbella sp. NPDC000426]|uniref:ABC transporter permease subunit n=1 Tax=Kribbella sp. NPDC000426 TaxID=3154255 RepID=UPI00332F9094
MIRYLRAEWAKFRSVPGWVRGTAVAALLILVFPVTGLGGGPPDQTPPIPIGPDGTPVSDAYYFVHRALTGDGRITVEVGRLTSLRTGAWAKAGLIVTAGPEPGARYAAIMVTGQHGVRMQHDYLYDRAGPPATARWLRLTRSGDTLTGEASTDGAHWTHVDTVRLAGLGATVQAGLFVACPARVNGLATAGDVATAEFGMPRLDGSWSAAWMGSQVGEPEHAGAFVASSKGFTVTGSGDLAPATRSDVPFGIAASDVLFGTFPALIMIVVIATLSITTEYRYGLIRTTLSAGTRRGRVLLAKTAVHAGVTFATSLVAAVVALPLWLRLIRSMGVYLFPASPGVLLRVAVGTAAVLAVTAVLALGVGVILRRSAAAVTAVVAATVLPYLIALTPFVPPAIAQWVTRVTPAAAFAVQQTLVRYPQVDSVYTPATGYYPLPPWAGLGVLCGYALVTLAVAAVLLRRRDV